MQVAVFSDSHGNKKAIDNIFNNYQFDHYIFLGDGVDDLGTYKYLPNVHIVRGNCDLFCDYPLELVLDIQGAKIFATHGHKYGVKHTLSVVAQEGRKVGADIVLIGHTHSNVEADEYGIKIYNPGALKNNQFAALDIHDGQIKINSIVL